MMKLTRLLAAGCALILLTNTVILAGAAYNRSGEPESRLRLTQRELRPDRPVQDKDNSGIELELDWRIAPVLPDKDERYSTGRWETPAWLDREKMAKLGFDVVKLARESESGRHDYSSKEVLLVLELNGPPYQLTLQRAREYAGQARVLLAGNPDSAEFKARAKDAEENLKNELTTSSRLFVVDAGVDFQTLRAAYPDNTRYAIVRGLIRPGDFGQGSRVSGCVTQLSAAHVNVPLIYRPVFDALRPFEVTLAFGRRLEPWIVNATGQ